MRKRLLSALLALVMCASLLSACSQSASATWQEQYDLGVRYLSEGNYQEAIIAFTAAIEIDPKRAEAYLGLADAYAAQGDIEQARQVLADAMAVVTDADVLRSRLEELNKSAEPEPTPEETVDYNNLVTDAYATEFTSENGKGLFAIPQINITGETIESINKEIWDELYVGVVEEIRTNRPDDGGYIQYDWAVNGNILSLWIESRPVNWAWWDYYVYNISISSRTLISKESLLNSYGMELSDYNEKVRQALYSYDYETMESNVSKNKDSLEFITFVNEQLTNTISDENIAKAVPFINQDGELCIVGYVYVIAGADGYFYVINLEDFKVSPRYPALFDLPAEQQNLITNEYVEWSSELIEDVSKQILAHYTELWKPVGTLSCFSNEALDYGDEMIFTLRYTRPDEEIAEIIANGGMPSYNIWINDIHVNKITGESYDENGDEDIWFVDLRS